jgi:hypothetical protein
LANNLKPLWTGEDTMFGGFTTLIASDTRLLAVGMDSELLLIDATADKFKPQGRVKLLDDEAGIYAHPAVVGNRLYYRGSDALLCIDLER